MELREYQKECIEAVFSEPQGSLLLIALAVGLGKSFVASQIYKETRKRYGNKSRILWVTRQQELTLQPVRYFENYTIGIEMGSQKSNGEDVVLATVQSLSKRLDRFSPNEFDICVYDEAQELPGKQYRKIAEYFKPKYGIALSGTPGGRSDGVRLDDIVDKIVYEKDLIWGIENGYLCDVKCRTVQLGYDLSNVSKSGDDFNQSQLAEAMQGTEYGIAEVYEKYRKGVTIIFATGVDHAKKISALIHNSKVIVGDTPKEERAKIIEDMNSGKLECCVSVNIFVQGIDVPRAQTAIFAKPSKAQGRIIQSIGRVLRTHDNKDHALIIDTVGVSKNGLNFANTLLGIDLDDNAQRKLTERDEYDLFDLPNIVEELRDCPETWILNTRMVDLFAKKNKIKTQNLNVFLHADGRMIISLPERQKIIIPAPDLLGMVKVKDLTWIPKEWEEYANSFGEKMTLQTAINAAKATLKKNYPNCSMIWDLTKAKKWGKQEPTEAQMRSIANKTKKKGLEIPQGINRLEASMILNRLNNK